MQVLKISEVIVLHVKKGFEERGLFMEKQLQQKGISFVYMLDGDIEDISDSRLHQYFGGEMEKKNAITSCALKHLLACEKIVAQENDLSLILEDDVQLSDNFVPVFNQSVTELRAMHRFENTPLFVSFENTGFKKVNKPEKNKFLYPAKETRAAGAYLLNRCAAEAIIKEAKAEKVTLPVDWFYNTLAEQKKIFIYWCDPAIAEQGSHNGQFESALSHRRAGVLRGINFKLQKLFKFK